MSLLRSIFAARQPSGGWALALGVVTLTGLFAVGCAGPSATGGSPTDPGGKIGSPRELSELVEAASLAPVVANVTAQQEIYDPIAADGSGTTSLPQPGVPLESKAPDGGPETLEVVAGMPKPGLELDDIDTQLAELETQLGEDEPAPAPFLATSEDAITGGDELPSPGLGGATRSNGLPPLNPFVEFGERIQVWPDGRITKPFSIPIDKGLQLLQLMSLAAPFEFTYAVVEQKAEQLPEAAANDDPDIANFVLLKKWDFEQLDNYTANVLQAKGDSKQVDIADLLVVTTSPATLREVEAFIELFAAKVPQIEITASILEVTFSNELDYGVTGPNGQVLVDFPEGTFIDSLAYNVPNSIEGVESILSIGAIQDGVALDAFIEAIQRWENVSIKTNPRIVVREGVPAEILNITDIPVFSFSGINLTGNFNASLQFKEVGTRLYITPRVMGSDTLAMNMYLEASQQIGTSVAFTDQNGNEFRAPLIAKRQARTIVYLKPGQAVAIGGLASEREEEAEAKVPILGDIPLIGWLFKSVRKRRERTIVMFLITPRILEGIDYNQELWDGAVLADDY
ncbi:MAG: hypothetical protein AAFZ65_15235 [Planctomycetota bacterium]